ncbi:hypothetical protein Dda_6294 [Drechslerella dactyloides]|uniref:C2H2-type domain-containing protein n=1 Tax=Drechslerella dactyloides TaxID=74499 RepID=A0AAD6IVJ2_DREDA|nr:hypothetical protein Dda_6294 [Drechslerella dactyloides]
MSYPMEFTLSNTSTIDSSMDEDFMLYSSNDEERLHQLHPMDHIPFPGEEGFSMFETMPPQYSAASMGEIDSDIFNPDFFRLPASTPRESSLLGLQDPLPAAFLSHTGPAGIDSFLDSTFGAHNGYPTPPSTLSSPYSPPTNNFVPFSPTKTRRQSVSSRRRQSIHAASPPSSPLVPGASSPTGGKPGVFTCPKCGAVFTFKTNKTRHINSRACEGKAASSPAHTGDAGCTKEYPCPIEGCSTVIKRRKDNLSVHLKKIHGLKMEVSRH